MDGYTKIRAFNPTRSRSVDFSDVSLSPPAKTQRPQITITSNKAREPFAEEEEAKIEEDEGQRFGVILRRNYSVSSYSSTSSQKFGRPSVRRAFSMRKSSSVSEGYCRIHDQWGPLSPPPPDGVDMMQMRSRKKRGSILKACKRLFGFS
ncbi:uncharacterized protein LOC131224535 [Magnolia sinica]|uniref:uncharacterized protein LOC131224535 n=1 Tax=Magnolia sinica TaxID=86752 RepID=UPI002658959C|nr:uncharacterized protein LOC131224535 [Magnolia sinica]